LAAPQRKETTPALKPIGPPEALVLDLRTAGHSTQHHPLKLLRAGLERWKVIPSHRLIKIRHHGIVRVAGVVTVRQRPPTAKGVCFLTLEDEFGMINVIVRPDRYEANRPKIRRAMILLIEGTMQRQGTVSNVMAEKLASLDSRWDGVLSSRHFH